MEEFEEIEVKEVTALEQIQRAEIDIQIATAHQYPRSMVSFKKRATEMVTMDEETAQSCIYRRPVGKEGKKVVYAEGKSIRMAEIVGACYGNLRVGSIIVEQTERQVKCRGMAHDLESNFAASSEVVESTVTKDGKPFSERMRITVAKACLAKARRDATFQVVPGALCKSLEEAARKTAIGTERTLESRRKKILDWINKLGIAPERVWTAIGVSGIDDVGLEELETLTGIRTSIKDNDIKVDEAFPIEDLKAPKQKQPEPDKAPNSQSEPRSDEPTSEPEPEDVDGPGGEPGAKNNNWNDTGKTDLEIVGLINGLRNDYNEHKAKLAAKFDINNIGQLLARFGVKALSRTDISPAKLEEISQFIEANK